MDEKGLYMIVKKNNVGWERFIYACIEILILDEKGLYMIMLKNLYMLVFKNLILDKKDLYMLVFKILILNEKDLYMLVQKFNVGWRFIYDCIKKNNIE